jgi:hypothetical protein
MMEKRQKTKKKIYLATALLVALVVTSGTFVYTYTEATATGDIETVEAIATVEESAGQPDWNSIVSLEGQTAILRPADKGDQTEIEGKYPDTGKNWDKLDEQIFDGDGTYVFTSASTWQVDLYKIAGTIQSQGVIDYVRVYAVFRATTTPTKASAEIIIKTNGTVYSGSAITVSEDYTPYSYTWNTNPQTDTTWTWDEIGALQIGIGLRRPTNAGSQDTRCTQVYVVVGYRHMVISGDIPIGDLFDITTHAQYTGDLGVAVYLLNTGSLVKAYNYVNIKLELEDSVEGTYQPITFSNGVATFKLEGSPGATRTLSVTGGSYSLVSGNPAEWQPGWSIIPELHCEITQR